ncbi:MAG: DUF2911 domain-containing protein [Rubricoccaceae bacterium]|nr:DUF2911 domain-containing protein [Rubricoccaceae bacterium]
MRPLVLLSVFSLFVLTACSSDAQEDHDAEHNETHEHAEHASSEHPHHPMRGNDEPRVSPNAAVMQTIGTTNVVITYGRPSVNDREIFGGLVPYNEVWRTGANEATTITFSDNVTVEGQPLDAGTYGLFTIPTESTWTIIFNATAEQWGAFNYDASQDVLRVEVEPTHEFHIEQMGFWFDNVTTTSATAVLGWADVMVGFDIEVVE